MKKLFLLFGLLLFFNPSISQCLSGDCTNGFGATAISGAKYNGYFKDGTYHGLGIYTAANGDVYYGEFYNGKFKGYAKYVWKDKRSYLGQYNNNSHHGNGIYTNENNNANAYTWENGTALEPFSVETTTNNPLNCIGNCVNGYGRITNSDDSFIQAIYSSSNPILGIISTKNTTYEGQILNGFPDGFGILIDNFGSYIGHFKSGLKNGNGIQIGFQGDVLAENWVYGIKSVGNDFVFNQKKFSSELKSTLNKSQDELELNSSLDRAGFGYILNTKFMAALEMKINIGVFSTDYLSISFNHNNNLVLTKTELVTALNKCAFLIKGHDNSYSFNNLKIKINDNYGLNLEAYFPEKPTVAKNTNCLFGNCENGFGKKKYTNGIYEGNFKNGEKHGEGTESYDNGAIYTGNFLNGTYNGTGSITYADKSSFTGQFKNNKRIKGKYIWVNGNIYNGAFTNDLKNGKGTFTWNDGATYSGDWVDGFRSGYGVYKWADGSSYEGSWKKNKKVKGNSKWANGNSYNGEWQSEKKHGQGTFYWKSGSKYIGEFKYDKKDGFGRTYSNIGILLFEGTWKNGAKLNGTFYYSDGKYVGPFVNDKPHGYGKFYDKNGTLKYSGQFENGNIKK